MHDYTFPYCLLYTLKCTYFVSLNADVVSVTEDRAVSVVLLEEREASMSAVITMQGMRGSHDSLHTSMLAAKFSSWQYLH